MQGKRRRAEAHELADCPAFFLARHAVDMGLDSAQPFGNRFLLSGLVSVVVGGGPNWIPKVGSGDTR